MRTFLSCVSSEFRSYRLKLANQLGALKGQPCEVRVQEDFQQGGFTLLDRLADYICECDLVVHLVGDACGSRPTPEHERTLFEHLGEAPPDPLPGWSYTQWEYRLARRFGRKVLVYFARGEALRDCGLPIRQSDEEARLQQAHAQHIRDCGQQWKDFGGHHELVREVFYDLGLEPDRKVNNLPYKSLGTLFKGREEFLEKILAALAGVDHRGHRRVAAITASATAATVHGLGGIGKTRAAIEYAHRHADEYTALLFVRADSPEGLKTNLAALCGPLVLDLAQKEERDLDVQFGAVLRWLQQHPGWFLILDNVDSEEAAKAVEDLLGRLSTVGQVLITSRLSRWSGEVEGLALDVLAEADAADFLLARTAPHRRQTPDDPVQARVLAVELGQLALALEQAGAYIERHRLTFAQYLEQWRSNHDKVLEWFNERQMQYPRSVAVTWQTTFNQLSEPARHLLYLLAWLAPDPIPESLLDVPVPGQEKSLSDPRDALADLEAYSLVTRADEKPAFSVHRLVQDVTRRSLLGDTRYNLPADSLCWIDLAFSGDPTDVRSWLTLVPLVPHASALVQFGDAADTPRPLGRLLNQLALFFHTRGQYARAEPLMRRLLAVDEANLGTNHPTVAADLSNLARLLQATNRQKEAEPPIRLALAIDEAHFGANHPAVARDLDGLAQLLQDADRLKEGEAMMRRALAIDQAHLGPDHPTVATDLNNLAQLLQTVNRLEEAEPLMRRALAIDEASFGANHPAVARDLDNLALLLQTTNRLKEAEPLMRRALAIDEVSFGADHPNVATDLNNLAALLQTTNRQKEAEPLMHRALAIDEASFGPGHPAVAGHLNNLARLWRITNRPKEAEPLVRRALAIDEASFGPNHPNVALDLNSLALLLHAMNRPKEAEPLARRALTIDEASFGADHPNVARDLNNLALLLLTADQLREAEPLTRRALVIDEASFGPGHPNVAVDLNNLAQLLLRGTARLAEAEPLMRRALTIDEASFGPDHPDVARDLNNLAGLLQATGRTPEAESLIRRALAIDEASFAPGHPEIATDLNNLARLLQATDRPAEAEPLMHQAVRIFFDFTRRTGHEHPHLRMAIENYGQLLLRMGLSRTEAWTRICELGREFGLHVRGA
jgi:tetratricopeptide (TPR) repeat protein